MKDIIIISKNINLESEMDFTVQNFEFFYFLFIL